MATQSRSVVLAKRPTENIVPGETFKLVTQAAPQESDLKDGEVLFESLYLSLDPAMRGWINDVPTYIPPVKIGEVMRGWAVGRIKASKSKDYPVGAYATGMVGWVELAIAKEGDLEKVDYLPENGRVTDAMGVLGITGLTAYFGLLTIGKVKADDFVVVSGAAGATGSVVGQIAKLKGAKVLGLAGSDDKVQWLKELGFDEALNYKDADFAKKFMAATKSKIDVFFDNVGGEILDLALVRAAQNSRFVICGGISQYNTLERKGPKNILMLVVMRIRMEGFIVLDYENEFPAARQEIAQWLAEGKLQRKETIIKGGLPEAEKALIELYNGVNTGKLLVEIKAEALRKDG